MVFTNNKQTEPFGFIFFKKLCSFALICALIWYFGSQCLQYYESTSRPTLTLKNEHLFDERNKTDFRLTNDITIEFCHINTAQNINVNCKSYKPNDNEYYGFELDEKCNNTKIPSQITKDYCVRYEFEHKGSDLLWIDISIEQSNQLNPLPEILNNSACGFRFLLFSKCFKFWNVIDLFGSVENQ